MKSVSNSPQGWRTCASAHERNIILATQRQERLFWSGYEEHLDEAAFLFTTWQEAMHAPNFTLQEVALGPEERLRAHLDGLVLGGRMVAERLLLPALGSEEPGLIRAAAFALASAEKSDYLEAVLAAFQSGDPTMQSAIATALAVCERCDLAAPLGALWRQAATEARALILDVLAARAPSQAAIYLSPALSSDCPALIAAALRLVRRILDRAWLPYVEPCLRNTDASVREEAIATAFALGSSSVVDACRQFLQPSSANSRTAACVLALEAQPRDRRLLLDGLANPLRTRDMLWALAFLGDLAATDTLISYLEDDKLGRFAGESLRAITGVVIEGALAQKNEPTDLLDASPDAPLPCIQAEDALRYPNASALKAWWSAARPQMSPDIRYVYGRPLTEQTLQWSLGVAAMWRRPSLALQLVRLARKPIAPNFTNWARAQVLDMEGFADTAV